MAVEQLLQDVDEIIQEARGLIALGRGHRNEANQLQVRGDDMLYTMREQLARRDINHHLKRRYEAKIMVLQTLLLRVQEVNTSVIVGRGLQRDEPARLRWDIVQSAFAGRIRTGMITNISHIDVQDFFSDAEDVFVNQIQDVMKTEKAVKVNAVLTCDFSKPVTDETEPKSFNTANQLVLTTTDLPTFFREHIRDVILKDLEEFQDRDSGWSMQSILYLNININKCNPIRASSYIDLPGPIKRRQACVNVQNDDTQCFKWAILSALHPVERHSERPAKYIHFINRYNWAGLTYPFMPSDIPKFELLNPNISINLFMLELKDGCYTVVPCYVTPRKREKHINLLLVQSYYVDENQHPDGEGGDEDDELPVYHYVWIKNLSRLINVQLTKNKSRLYVCDRCLHCFRTQEKLHTHEPDCYNMNTCRIFVPQPRESVLKFKNHRSKERVPFVVYADFECLLKSVRKSDTTFKTQVHQLHEPFSVGYYVHCSYDSSLSGYHSYRGENPAAWLAERLVRLGVKVRELYNNPIPMAPLTPDEQREFSTAALCHICEKPLGVEQPVRDHCHLSGKYRGPAHNDCNINYKDSRIIPIVFHNFSGYDAHFIVCEISNCVAGRINILPLNMERYISMTKHLENSDIQLRFIDSFRFMASSLDKLASYLEEHRILRDQFANLSDTQKKLLSRKGVFPYEYVDSWPKLDRSTLPAKDDFYSTLTGSNISDSDYSHAQQVWSDFGIQTLGEYSDLYLKTDVLLLADVFENFRNNCMRAYKLDPAHYHTTPGLTWDAMLKSTKIELELLTDIDMIMFIERGIRGGISQCSNRYAAANNRYMPTYNEEEPSHYLMYYDVNNLYGWAMVQNLPYGGFEWVSRSTDWNVEDNSPVGYILEVDLDYPHHIHDAHKDFPFCAEFSAPPGCKQKKLLTTLLPKFRYVIHYRNLKQALEHGLVLSQVHRILKFNQKPWLKSYIDMNTEFRKKAVNDFEKNFYKLLNNAVFGKTMENVRKHVNIKLVNKWKGRYGAEALIARPNFHSRAIFNENLVAIQLRKTSVLLNKPIYIGFCVLEISKTCIYDFHYNIMPQMFPECGTFKLMYTDTDSLIYDIEHDDVYGVMGQHLQYFDTSEYLVNNEFHLPLVNKKVIGLMKDECSGQIMTEFVGLRSKMYSIRVNGKDCLKKCKGVKSCVVKKTITFEDYVRCLKENVTETRTQYLFRSRLHEVQTIRQEKLALSPLDNKRCLCPGTTATLPWGHYSIMDEE